MAKRPKRPWSAVRRARFDRLRIAKLAVSRVDDLILTPTECGYCKLGHRRRRGIHVPSQRVGMIPEAPCLLAWAVDLSGGGRSPEPEDGKKWVGYYRDAHGVHQVVLRNGTTRRFKTSNGATGVARGFLKDEG